jgi:hypothetical protein
MVAIAEEQVKVGFAVATEVQNVHAKMQQAKRDVEGSAAWGDDHSWDRRLFEVVGVLQERQ